MEKRWRDNVLEKIPHGEEGSLQLTLDEAFEISEILIKKGYAVCIAGGDIGDTVKLSWIYAGDTDNLTWADYSNIVFTHADYISDYPEAYYSMLEEECGKNMTVQEDA